VAASCAIRGFFEPVPINRRRYVDGGLNSLCHLDLLEGSDLDVVICFSAMTAPLQRPGAQLLHVPSTPFLQLPPSSWTGRCRR
jgi:predicted acylesterase/phospholipase RssA